MPQQLSKAQWLDEHFDCTEPMTGEVFAWAPRERGEPLRCYPITAENGKIFYSAYLSLCSAIGIEQGKQPKLSVYASFPRDGAHHHNAMYGDFSIGGKTERVVAISEGLFALATQEEMLTIIAHEIGHFIKNHPLKSRDDSGEDALQSRKQELEADDIAIQMMGKKPFIALQTKLMEAIKRDHFSGPMITIRGYFTRHDDQHPSHAIRILHASQKEERYIAILVR